MPTTAKNPKRTSRHKIHTGREKERKPQGVERAFYRHRVTLPVLQELFKAFTKIQGAYRVSLQVEWMHHG